mmetsp:Transcript_2089/g.3765  ORF Transcript_2089/g.3765 Transcript_2089/m.3765 type:complete len:342 (+) Transcript_2089:915-1940(+)
MKPATSALLALQALTAILLARYRAAHAPMEKRRKLLLMGKNPTLTGRVIFPIVPCVIRGLEGSTVMPVSVVTVYFNVKRYATFAAKEHFRPITAPWGVNFVPRGSTRSQEQPRQLNARLAQPGRSAVGNMTGTVLAPAVPLPTSTLFLGPRKLIPHLKTLLTVLSAPMAARAKTASTSARRQRTQQPWRRLQTRIARTANLGTTALASLRRPGRAKYTLDENYALPGRTVQPNLPVPSVAREAPRRRGRRERRKGKVARNARWGRTSIPLTLCLPTAKYVRRVRTPRFLGAATAWFAQRNSAARTAALTAVKGIKAICAEPVTEVITRAEGNASNARQIHG